MESNFLLNFICSERPDMEFSSPKWCSSTVWSSLLERATLWVVFLKEEACAATGAPRGLPQRQPWVAGGGQTPTADTLAGLYLPVFLSVCSRSCVLDVFLPSFSLPPSSVFFASHQNGAQRHDRRCTSLIGSRLPKSSVMFGFMFQS